MNVSLEKKEAKISYSNNDVTAEQIAKYIEEMGFTAFVKEINGKSLEATTEVPLKNNNVENGDISLQINGGGDVKAQSQLTKCFLHITVIIYDDNNYSLDLTY